MRMVSPGGRPVTVFPGLNNGVHCLHALKANSIIEVLPLECQQNATTYASGSFVLEWSISYSSARKTSLGKLHI